MGKITSEFNIFKMFYETISNGMIPLFNNFKSVLNSGDDQQNFKTKTDLNFVNNIYKKFTDLEMTLH